MRIAWLSLLTVLLMTACVAARRPSQDMSGTWRDNGAGITFAIRDVDNQLRVVSAESDDGEEYTVRGSGMRGGYFAWTVEVPSTGYVLSYEVTGTGAGVLHTRWQNEFDAGIEDLHRATDKE